MRQRVRGPAAVLLVVAGVVVLLVARWYLPEGRGIPFLPGTRRQGSAGPDYLPLKQQLEGFLAGQRGIYGIYFQDLDSGRTFGINQDVPIQAASTIKVPVVLYLNRLIARGKMDWNDRVAYNSTLDYQEGAGVLQYWARDGDTYSLRVLSNLSITVSDNISHRMLVRHLGQENVVRFMQGVATRTSHPFGSGLTTARDMGLFLKAVLDFTRDHPEAGRRLLDDMSHSIYHTGLPGLLPEKVRVAHKEGSIEGVADDVGIVFSSRPYILSILSRGIADEDEGFRVISRISRMVYDYQEGRADSGARGRQRPAGE